MTTDTTPLSSAKCPKCAGDIAYAEHPARCFCDKHFREQLVPMGICPTDLTRYRNAVIANLNDRCEDPIISKALRKEEKDASHDH